MVTFLRMSRLAIALGFAARILRGAADQVLVAELIDDIVKSDIAPGGNCESGCTREMHAAAHVDGTPKETQCLVEMRTPFDTVDPTPGLLTAHIYCEDETGKLIKEGTGPCRYSICVDFQWKDGDEEGTGGQLEYDVVIIRDDKPRAPHTVYVDLSVQIDPTATVSDVNSCEDDQMCVLKECFEPTGYRAEMVLVDTVGDGWVGGIDGRFNMWTLKNTDDDSVITRGTLAANHHSSELIECLEDGEYIFETTANAAFAEDIRWNICNKDGVAGESLRFIVSDSKCDSDLATIIPRATAEDNGDEFGACSLPLVAESTRSAPCTTLSSGLKVDGVAMYYDERCTEADYSGCGARSIDFCRLCFVDKELWMAQFPNDRVPDYEMCPCCVADLLGVECATAGSGGGGLDNDVVIAISVAIAGVIAVALCLSCAFWPTILRMLRRLKRKKHRDLETDPYMNGAAAFPDSPTAGNGGTVNGNGQGHRGRVVSGHFPIPRFDSIRGRFDSGIFASNNTAAYTAPGGTSAGTAIPGTNGHTGGGEKHHKEASVATIATAASSPSASQTRAPPNGPRSTVLEGRLVSKGYTTSDVGRPVSGGGGASKASAGWGIAMSGEYPDLDATDPYAGDNAMMDQGGAGDLISMGQRQSPDVE